MSSFHTDPDNPQAREQLKGDFDFSEALQKCLEEKGMPLYHARTATIDFKHLWIPLWKKKWTASKVAGFLFADIVKSYKLSITSI